MANPTIDRILRQIGDPELIDKLIRTLPGSDLNSLLLEINRQMAGTITPQALLKAYQQNRFVAPSSVSALQFAKAEVQVLAWAEQHGFQTIELSPLAPLGNCSAIGLADQNKIVSATRQTEVVADATNLMALEASVRRRESAFDYNDVNLCTTHRHVRAQTLPDIPGFTPHFKLFCAVTSGRDSGDFMFEKSSMLRHLSFYRDYFNQAIELAGVKVTIKALVNPGSDNRLAPAVFNYLATAFSGLPLAYEEVPSSEHRYYQSLRFSIDVNFGSHPVNIGDGGFVDWGAKLTSNNKERMLTSGLGLELLVKTRQELKKES